MKGYQADHAIATMCRVLGVSPSGYYAWQHRAPSARAQQDAELTMKIHTIHLESRGTYGAPRVHADLAAQGIRVGRKRVARLMRAACVQGVSRRKWVTTTTRDPDARPAPDLVQRDFTAAGPDRLWVADITYVPTGAGFLYLAVVLDALAFGVRPSMGSVGDAYDNALCESFFATVECELLDRERFRTPAEARRALFDFIEGWYNPHRRHSALGFESPLRYERSHAAAPVRTTPLEKSVAALPPGATIGQGGAISLSPQNGPTTAPTNRGRA